mgnify:FL=1
MTENLIGEAHRPGRIEVVCGSMFSGKTEELIRRMKRAKFAKQKVEIFKPALDTRYSEEDVVSMIRTLSGLLLLSPLDRYCYWLLISTWWVSMKPSSWTMDSWRYATNSPTVA